MPARCPCGRNPRPAPAPPHHQGPAAARTTAATSPAPRCWPSSTPNRSPSPDGPKPCSATSRTSGWRWGRPRCQPPRTWRHRPLRGHPHDLHSARARPGWRPPPRVRLRPRGGGGRAGRRARQRGRLPAALPRGRGRRPRGAAGGQGMALPVRAPGGRRPPQPGPATALRGRGSVTDVPRPPWTGAIPASSRPPSSSRGRPRAGQPSPPAGRRPGRWPARRRRGGRGRPATRAATARPAPRRGRLHPAGEQLASCVTRVWWPLALAASLVSRRTRRPLLAAAALPVVIGWVRTTGGPRASRSKPWAYAALRAVDDLSYGAGVWAGALEERRPGAILPRRPEKVRARSRRRPPPTGARR